MYCDVKEKSALVAGNLLGEYRDFIARAGLVMEDCPDTVVFLRDDESDRIAATGALRSNLLLTIAVDSDFEGEGLAASVVSHLCDIAHRKGENHLFLSTKPKNEKLFSSLGFYPVVSVGDAVYMENSATGLDRFLNSLPRFSGKIGAIVANCDPFTLGHLGLVEYACGAMDGVYLFILSENSGFFPPEVRLDLAKKACSHLKNCAVVPGMDYLISRASFPAYFIKDRARAEDVRAELDIALFARRFAPALGIGFRFVGSEPFDEVTNAYNAQLKASLPKQGIELCEIPRIGGISASEVRKLYMNRNTTGDWHERLVSLVPRSTYEYIESIS